MTAPRSWAEALDAHAHPERAVIETQAHALTAHAVGWVTAAERLGLEIREEEPAVTRARVLDAIGEPSEAEARVEKAERAYDDLLGEWKLDMNRIHRTEVVLHRAGFGPLVHGRSPIDEWASAAVKQRDEAEAIVRAVAELHPSDVYGSCLLCGTDNGSAHETDCPYLRARAFVAREGREDQR